MGCLLAAASLLLVFAALPAPAAPSPAAPTQALTPAAPGPTDAAATRVAAAAALAQEGAEAPDDDITPADGKAAMIVFVLLLGGVVYWVTRKVRRRAEAPRTWPTVEGTVIKSTIVSGQGYENSLTTYYQPYVRYRYEVAGKAHEADRVRFDPWPTTKADDARKAAEAYPVGATVTVHYDPKKPGQAALDVNAKQHPFYLMGIWAPVVAVVLILVIVLVA